MSNMNSARQLNETEVPLLARIWREDDVWNVSAFDLPIVAYSERIEEARTNFEEAVNSHFQALAALDRLENVASSLRDLATQRGFYEERIKPRVLVENFLFHPLQKQAA
jgi:hypothetical protein